MIRFKGLFTKMKLCELCAHGKGCKDAGEGFNKVGGHVKAHEIAAEVRRRQWQNYDHRMSRKILRLGKQAALSRYDAFLNPNLTLIDSNVVYSDTVVDCCPCVVEPGCIKTAMLGEDNKSRARCMIRKGRAVQRCL